MKQHHPSKACQSQMYNCLLFLLIRLYLHVCFAICNWISNAFYTPSLYFTSHFNSSLDMLNVYFSSHTRHVLVHTQITNTWKREEITQILNYLLISSLSPHPLYIDMLVLVQCSISVYIHSLRGKHRTWIPRVF